MTTDNTIKQESMDIKNRPVLTSKSRIGIVNRGEAAVRFIRAVKEYNNLYDTDLKTVAFYIPADMEALFVKEADIALPFSRLARFASLEGSAYLNHDLILEALATTECDAVWPGWGFLAEDAEFARLITENGLTFIGPTAEAMALLGDKIEAKKLAEEANVPVAPWVAEAIRDLDHCRQLAEQVGFPLIIKAAHAGGGRGIRVVKEESELEQQFNSARDETIRITGNDILFMEYFVEHGRHLEVQIVADRLGNVSTFGVRDCSVQRKNQKIIEETPPPHLPEQTIQDMQAAAARLIEAAKYDNAGTVEFIYDINKSRFYFMEVNTRLQVEHPISELTHTVDLVRNQLNVAMGKKVQEAPQPHGVAIELRLNAEDPDRDFTPSPGQVLLYVPPSGPGIRVDSGIEEGSDIPQEFDSMIAKIIAHAATRREAIASLQRALREIRIKIEGGTTNRAFLLDLLADKKIREGGVHTRYVEEFVSTREENVQKTDWDIAIIVSVIQQYLKQYDEELANFKQKFHGIGSPTMTQPSGIREITQSVKGVSYTFAVKSTGNNFFHLEIDGQTLVAQYLWWGEEAVLLHGNKRYAIQTVPRGDVLQCEVNGTPYFLEQETQGSIRSPSPAIVISVAVEPGQRVSKDDVLLTLEAMKMEMIVAAPADGSIKSISVQDGEQVTAGQTLIELDMKDQKDEEVEEHKAPTLGFERLAVPHAGESREALATQWKMHQREFLGFFLGYDCENPGKLLAEMESLAATHVGLHPVYLQTLVHALDTFVAVEQLFSREKLRTEGGARAVDFQELLMHFFWRSEDREKGLPEEFLSRLERAARWYPWANLENNEAITRALYRIYISHSTVSQKMKVLYELLGKVEKNYPLSPEAIPQSHLATLLSEITRLAMSKSPSLADAAMHARYTLIDSMVIEQMKDEKQEKVAQLLDMIAHSETDYRTSGAELIQDVAQSGQGIVRDLVALGRETDNGKRALALELLARRSNRDRKIGEGATHMDGNQVFYRLESSDKHGEHETIVAILDETELDNRHAIRQFCQNNETSRSREVVFLISHAEKSEDQISEVFQSDSWESVDLCCLGFVSENKRINYRTFLPTETGNIEEDVVRRFFSPLMYRELRVDRLRKFDLTLKYRGENVFLFAAKARDNSRDERFFGLVEVTEARPELAPDKRISRIVAFDNAFLEIVHAIRAEQASRKRRLFWNRIIVHIHSPLNVGLTQMRDYASQLAERTGGLGLEKVVAYTRVSKRRELEFLFENISGSVFRLRHRAPSSDPLEPLDGYAASVVRARQRGNVYPYRIVEMLTRWGTAEDPNAGGTFNEYDIEQDQDTGEYRAVPTKHGQLESHTSNIIFGLITNYRPNREKPLTRVLIMGDPTVDMCALGEAECSRINAAIDLARDKNIPVEWVAVSAGARIDMNSGTENLDWTARTLRKIIEFTQGGGEINIIVPGINVGAQSYWNAEATMLMHTRGLLIMTEEGAMLLTGKKALDVSGSVSAEDNVGIGGVEKIMGPNGQSQVRVADLPDAIDALFKHYDLTYCQPETVFPEAQTSSDSMDRDITPFPYTDRLDQGFTCIGDILSKEKNPERKKPFDMRQIMQAVKDQDSEFFERWHLMQDAETAIVWETRIGGFSTGLIGIESRPLARLGTVPNDGPDTWTGGTLFPLSSKKVARALNAFSRKLPVVILANLSGFDGSPESLRNLQLEYGAEIGRAVVNFKGPIVFVVIARYHGGAYVVFSRSLNPHLKAAALSNTYASVIGGAPAAAVVFPRDVMKDTYADERIIEAKKKLSANNGFSRKDFESIYQKVYNEKQTALGQRFDKIHCVERAREVGSIEDIVDPKNLRPYLISSVKQGMFNFLEDEKQR